MMNSQLYKNIANCSACRISRNENAKLVLHHKALFPDLFAAALNTENNHHHKACWILELVVGEQLHLLSDHLPIFCLSLSKFTNQSAMRSISKICMFLSQHLILTSIQEQQITENCFDWLIDEKGKVATKAYSIRALFQLGKKHKWIYPELQRILSEDYPKHSPAYKAVAREILKKIK